MLKERRIHCAVCRQELGIAKAYTPWRRQGDPIRQCSCGGCGDDGVHQEWALLHRMDTDLLAPATVMGMLFLNALLLPMLPVAVKLLLLIVTAFLVYAADRQQKARDASIGRMSSREHLDDLYRLNLMTEEQHRAWCKGNPLLRMYDAQEKPEEPKRSFWQRLNHPSGPFCYDEYVCCPKCGKNLKLVLVSKNHQLTRLWGNPVLHCSCGAIARNLNKNELALSPKARSMHHAVICGLLYGAALALLLIICGVSAMNELLCPFVVLCDLIAITRLKKIMDSRRRMRDPKHLEELRTLHILSEDAYQAWMEQRTQPCFDKQPVSED